MELESNSLKNDKKEYSFKCPSCGHKEFVKTRVSAIEILGSRCKKCEKGFYQPFMKGNKNEISQF
jgi:DNA-directed RNA polymerase subunit RPC12/RpoP